MIDCRAFIDAVLRQDAAALRRFFTDGASVSWPCTGEVFSAEEYVRVNCEYPGDWAGEIERTERLDGLVILVTRVWPKDKSASYHAVSFLRCEGDRIAALDEYWADDGPPPAWRQTERTSTERIGHP